ncbi:MAG: penicillin-binding protein, partial [Actinobacteria bacterium]|nr:penicillin-binding protein [Actinomycetota bacterium]
VSVLRGVVDGGTGTKARQRDRLVAGKTGTSQEWRDAWFIGFTPQLSTAVWMGNPNKQDSMRNVGGIRVTGGSYPAATWGAYTAEALEGQPVLKFPEPDLRAFGKTKTVKVSKEAGGKGSTTTVKKKPKKKSGGTRRGTTPTTSTGSRTDPSAPSDDSGGTTGGGFVGNPEPTPPPSSG